MRQIIYMKTIDHIEVLANAIHSGRSRYSWDINIMCFPIYQIRLKIHSNSLETPMDQNALQLPKPR